MPSHHAPDPIAAAKAQEATRQFAFRDATMEDVEALQKMIGDSLWALGRGYYSEEELEGSVGWLFGPDRVLLHDHTYFILHPIDSPNTIAACGGWSFRRTLYGADTAPTHLRLPEARDPARERASIRAIFTHPEWARRGLGTMMMRYCEGRARESGFLGLEMGATLSGVALYERCGYVRSGKVDCVRCPNGEGIRIIHMLKDLPAEEGGERGGVGEIQKEAGEVESVGVRG